MAETQRRGGLHRRLSSFGVLLLTMSCLSPVFSIYGSGADVLSHAGTGAAPLFLLALGAAAIWAMVYAELGSAYPYAGGDYVGVGRILGPWAGAVTLALWAVTAGPSVAFEVKIIATYAGQLAPEIPSAAITYGSLILAVGVALLAVRTGAWVTGVFLTVEMLAVAVLMFLGLAHPARGLAAALAHPLAFGNSHTLGPVALPVLALAGLGAVYSTVGGNQAIGFGEELKDPHRRMGRVIVMACAIGSLTTALPIVAVVFGARNLGVILSSPAPIAAFVSEAAGPWAAKALSAGVALAIFNAVIAQIMISARLYFSMGRDGLLPDPLGRLVGSAHDRSGSPRAATLILGVFSAACCLSDPHTLLIFLTGTLVYGWSLVCLAVIVGRRKGLTGGAGYWRSPWFPLGPVLGLIMAAVLAIADLADADAGRPSLFIMGVLVVVAALWSRFGLERRAGGWTPALADVEG